MGDSDIVITKEVVRKRKAESDDGIAIVAEFVNQKKSKRLPEQSVSSVIAVPCAVSSTANSSVNSVASSDILTPTQNGAKELPIPCKGSSDTHISKKKQEKFDLERNSKENEIPVVYDVEDFDENTKSTSSPSKTVPVPSGDVNQPVVVLDEPREILPNPQTNSLVTENVSDASRQKGHLAPGKPGSIPYGVRMLVNGKSVYYGPFPSRKRMKAFLTQHGLESYSTGGVYRLNGPFGPHEPVGTWGPHDQFGPLPPKAVEGLEPYEVRMLINGKSVDFGPFLSKKKMKAFLKEQGLHCNGSGVLYRPSEPNSYYGTCRPCAPLRDMFGCEGSSCERLGAVSQPERLAHEKLSIPVLCNGRPSGSPILCDRSSDSSSRLVSVDISISGKSTSKLENQDLERNSKEIYTVRNADFGKNKPPELFSTQNDFLLTVNVSDNPQDRFSAPKDDGANAHRTAETSAGCSPQVLVEKWKEKNIPKDAPSNNNCEEQTKGVCPSASNSAPVIAVTQAPVQLRPIVVDGANVGYRYSKQINKKVLDFKGVELVFDYFFSRGHMVSVVFSDIIETAICNSPSMTKIFNARGIVFTPHLDQPGYNKIKLDDDRFVVQIAAERKGVIISADFYRDLLEEAKADGLDEWITVATRRLLIPTFAGENVYFDPRPYGPKGPRLEEILRF